MFFIGLFLGSVVKQGGSVYREATQELSAVGQDATRGLTDLRETIMSRTRSLSLVGTTTAPQKQAPSSSSATPAGAPDASSTSTATAAATVAASDTARDTPSEDGINESETVLSRLRGEAAKRLKDLQRAEDAADEALLRFGSNLRDFFSDAIKIAPPAEGQAGPSGPSPSAVLFESKDAQGKRVIHATRFEAQMHVIHTNPESFTKDPSGPEYATWSTTFDVDKKTEGISLLLSEDPELRATMEKLVPDQIRYADFWRRYFFLRHGIETAEERRKALLKGRPPRYRDDRAGERDADLGACAQPHPAMRRSVGARKTRTRRMNRRMMTRSRKMTRSRRKTSQKRLALPSSKPKRSSAGARLSRQRPFSRRPARSICLSLLLVLRQQRPPPVLRQRSQPLVLRQRGQPLGLRQRSLPLFLRQRSLLPILPRSPPPIPR